MRWPQSIRDAWNLLLPVECAGCAEDGRVLCAPCAAALVPDPCLRSVGDLRVVTALRYEGVARRVILGLKEGGRTDAAAALAPALSAALARALAARRSLPEIVVVPTGRAAYRRRGYHPLGLVMARAGIRHSRLLRPTRGTSAQKALGAAARAGNVDGAFVARGDLHGRQVLIVDDVMTTGATLLESARALRAAGGEVVGAATLAFTPRLMQVRDNGPSSGLPWGEQGA